MLEPAEAPVRLLLLARHRQRHIEAVVGGKLAGVLDYHAHAVGELEILQQKRDPQRTGIVQPPPRRSPA
jgi:hypothetical protein